MSYAKIKLTKPSGISDGAGSGKNKVVIVDAEDVLVYPPRDANGVLMLGSFVLKSGAKMQEFYTTKSKGEAPVESDGDEDAQSIKQMFNCQHPGNKLAVKEFVQFWFGKSVYIFHTSCTDDFTEVMGTPCAPLQLKPSKTDSNDARFWSMKFEAYAKSAYVPGHYVGNLIFENPTAVADATVLELLKANGSQYKLAATSATTVASVHVIDLDHDQIVTLIGQGGSTPTTLVQGVSGEVTVALKAGTTWTALDGAVIQLKVFKAGSITYLLELSRA